MTTAARIWSQPHYTPIAAGRNAGEEAQRKIVYEICDFPDRLPLADLYPFQLELIHKTLYFAIGHAVTIWHIGEAEAASALARMQEPGFVAAALAHPATNPRAAQTIDPTRELLRKEQTTQANREKAADRSRAKWPGLPAWIDEAAEKKGRETPTGIDLARLARMTRRPRAHYYEIAEQAATLAAPYDRDRILAACTPQAIAEPARP